MYLSIYILIYLYLRIYSLIYLYINLLLSDGAVVSFFHNLACIIKPFYA